MFSNPGAVLKRAVIAFLILATIGGGILGRTIGEQADGETVGFLLGAAIAFIMNYVLSLVLLTIADMAENINDIRETVYSIKYHADKENRSNLSDISPVVSNSHTEEQASRTWKCSCGQVMPASVRSCQRCGAARNDYN